MHVYIYVLCPQFRCSCYICGTNRGICLILLNSFSSILKNCWLIIYIDYVKSIWLVQQEHRTINQEQPYIYTACLKYTSVAVTQILQLWYMELGAFNLSHGEVAAECLSLPTVSPQTVCPLRYSLRQCQSNITLRKRFQNDFPTFVILYL